MANESTDVLDGTVAECERLRLELQETKDLYLRTLAEFDNYRKRIDRDQAEIGVAAKRDLLLAILDIADNFELAIGAAAAGGGDDPNALLAGVTAIYRQIQRLLEVNDVVPFESVGEPFDPERHEAIGVVKADGVRPDSVANELRRGYLWRGRLLRPARVQVAE